MDDHLSRSRMEDRTPSVCSQPRTLASNLNRGPVGDCCGEDCPFHSQLVGWAIVSVALTAGMSPAAPVRTVNTHRHAFPWLSPGTLALCSSDFPLAEASDRPSGIIQLLRRRSMNERRSMVPKGRFELPRPYGHYALNVARLPVPPLRRVALSSASYSIRTGCVVQRSPILASSCIETRGLNDARSPAATTSV